MAKIRGLEGSKFGLEVWRTFSNLFQTLFGPLKAQNWQDFCNSISLQKTGDKNPDNFLQNAKSLHANQGGEGEVVGQLSCIYETITTKIEKKLKKFFI